MKILSANVNGRVRAALAPQLEAVLDRVPDIICLQEVTRGSYDDWCRGLTAAGYSVASTVDLLAVLYPPPPYPSPPFPSWEEPHDHVKRKNFNLTASRYPIAPLAGLAYHDAEAELYAFPEKFLAAHVSVDGVEVAVHNTHLPPGVSRGVVKVQAYEAIAERIGSEPGVPSVLCGDFNDPGAEDQDGPVIECGPPWSAEIRHRWKRAVEGVLLHPGWREVYRDVHTRGEPLPASHLTGFGKGTNPRRYDHIFATPQLTTRSCRYLSDWLEATPERRRLSDHAPIEAELDPSPAESGRVA